ncbi:hypothetical protein JCM3766R1_006092 [Sporobolomyces carnicolor]
MPPPTKRTVAARLRERKKREKRESISHDSIDESAPRPCDDSKHDRCDMRSPTPSIEESNRLDQELLVKAAKPAQDRLWGNIEQEEDDDEEDSDDDVLIDEEDAEVLYPLNDKNAVPDPPPPPAPPAPPPAKGKGSRPWRVGVKHTDDKPRTKQDKAAKQRIKGANATSARGKAKFNAFFTKGCSIFPFETSTD